MTRNRETKPDPEWTYWASACAVIAFVLLMALTMSGAFRKDEPSAGRSPLSHIPESIMHLEPTYAATLHMPFGHME
ncbi:MAG TPA: hypothetical protein VNQ97_01280 [Burkholderiaceae bacterium]|nr:hypothetical protein [Burkholderiaceae bacterium]